MAIEKMTENKKSIPKLRKKEKLAAINGGQIDDSIPEEEIRKPHINALIFLDQKGKVIFEQAQQDEEIRQQFELIYTPMGLEFPEVEVRRPKLRLVNNRDVKNVRK